MRTKDSVEVAGATDPGCVRRNNEDNFAVDPELGLLLVADGMGGHNSGEVASDLAAKTILDFARRMLGGNRSLLPEGGTGSLSPRGRQLEYFVKTANTMIYEKGRAFPKDAGMGTTVVAALLDARSLTVAHVGDSRLYIWRNGELTQLTEDHSLVGEQVKRGQITSAEAARSNLQNILTRALGAEGDVQVDVADHPLLPGDLVLLATDGLSKMVSDADVARTIAAGAQPQAVVDALIAQARAAGGVDNVTVVAARVPSREDGGMKGLVARLFGR
ncbi:MAG TPA: Stp1/IreP family PP2C-type Ser/Thr phosphatase [Elusimicrobiota bacterium]|jgi:protein phosphatase|nr:Stp1/IreP family PP2C-type Ser/Thr phosphatase [Elusimicrobiota bacterium]